MFGKLSRVSVAHLSAGISASKQHTRSLASESGSLTRLAKVAQGLDDGLDSTLLTKTSLNRSDEGSSKNSLGVHFGDQRVWSRVLVLTQ